MYAMNMYSGMKGAACLNPPADPGLAAGWQIAGYLTANDAVFPPQSGLGAGAEVNYGFVARNLADPTSYVAVIRGTDGFIEWIEDAEFVPIPHPRLAGLTVEQGFWGIYASMRLIAPDGSQLAAAAADGIPTLLGANGTLMVVGHSLGSAIATYLSLDLARGPLGARVSACLFASPQPGDTALAQFYDQIVANYRVFNYVLDVVPRVPTGLGYSALLKTTVLQPSTAEASIRVDVGCNHHVICYCAMLDYENTPYQHVATIDTACAACILGPETASPTIAKILADL